jgi:Spy/CpxP family protein refolding chaperone
VCIGAAALMALASATAFGPLLASAQAPSGAAPAPSRGPDPRQPSGGRSGSQVGWEWWNDADVQREIGLSAEKVHQIDDFYQRRIKDMKLIGDEFTKQFKELDAMTKAAVVDEPTYGLQVLRVESLRSRLIESRTMMLYRIYRILEPQQYRKLQDIFDRRARMGGPGNPGGPNGRGRE